MLNKNYPLHDMNKVFDMFEETLRSGGCADNSMEEMLFLNKLFASLPAEAVEYGMMFLNGNRDLPSSCDEIMPLYIRFVSFAEYLEKIESLRDVPSNMTTEAIMERKKIMDSLEEHEQAFGKPLLGYKFNSENSSLSEDTKAEENEEEEGGNALHLMNSSAVIFVCEDITKTALFYETKCGFKASHLEDEAMPHIRLTRDNIVINLVQGGKSFILSRLSVSKYDLYIYASEPFLLQNELKSAEVVIKEELPDAQSAEKSPLNRQFVFEDNDGRLICVSQSTEIV